ncbi:MAG: hypothetical protein NTW65_07360 [Deltaproteobacteria bacterium]|nr:hypothetical protein [Deltaproteobacteria bacterium]
MKGYYKVILIFIGVYILFCASLANAGMYYKTVEQPQNACQKIKNGTEFSVLPIDFSAINAKDLGYSKNEEWDADKSSVPQAFADSFPVLLKEAKVSNKTVTVIKSTDKPTNGIVAQVAVTKINLNWNAWTNKPDEYICKITFTDAADGQKLYSAVVSVSTYSGNPFASAWASFGARINSAAYNMAWVLTKIMIDGKVEPAEH